MMTRDEYLGLVREYERLCDLLKLASREPAEEHNLERNRHEDAVCLRVMELGKRIQTYGMDLVGETLGRRHGTGRKV